MENQGDHFKKRMDFFLDFMGFLDTIIFHDFQQYFAHLSSSDYHSDYVFNRLLVERFNQQESGYSHGIVFSSCGVYCLFWVLCHWAIGL